MVTTVVAVIGQGLVTMIASGRKGIRTKSKRRRLRAKGAKNEGAQAMAVHAMATATTPGGTTKTKSANERVETGALVLWGEAATAAMEIRSNAATRNRGSHARLFS